VKWKGYDEGSWEPATNVDGLQAINIFHTEQPGKPGFNNLVGTQYV
jgi:hypothetical protein